ncbi:prolyl oligopeptidase family serine peptidase [Roseateles sp. NT4]|uniref:prolyl oligopeptidase family serine peptidase n=1 Tax=Roseateles sp. NT4 TaxID=3453715 RepID=UPI003EEF752A
MKTRYPATRTSPETVTYGPVTYVDAYRWLAENTAETLEWQALQDDDARAACAAVPALAKLRALLADGYVDMFSFHAPRPLGGRWFRRDVPAGARSPCVTVSDSIDGEQRLLFDVASCGPHAVLYDMKPSPDASLLLVTVIEGSGTVVRVIDVETAEVRHVLPFATTTVPAAWLPGNAGFMYTGVADPALAHLPAAPGLRVFEQLLDGELTKRLIPLAHAHPAVMPTVTADGRYAIIRESQTSVHPTYIKRLLPDAQWEPFLDASYGLVKGSIVGDQYVAITMDTGPNGRLVAIPLSSPRDRSTWREVLPVGEATLASITECADRLVVTDMPKGISRLRVVALDGTVEREIGLPSAGAVGKFALGFSLSIVDELVWSDGRRVSFVHSSLLEGPRAYCHDVVTGKTEALTAPGRQLDGASLQTRTTSAADGHEVTYHVLRGPGPQAAPRPTIVTGYGGFNLPWLPCWSEMAKAWVRAGGAWVHVHLRGGGEFGLDFWRGGRMAEKPNTFADLFAVLEDLPRSGIARPEQIGITGTSNGGLAVCAAIAFRPELFGAAVPQVPLCDVLDCVRDPFTARAAAADYGNALVAEEAQWLYRWSPYQNLQAGKKYPAVLIDCGADDFACPPWHGRKLAAWLQNQAAPGSGPVLLRVRQHVGHNTMTRDKHVERDSEELAFLAEHLGLLV